MASTFSNNKGYELMATGEDDGTWGIKANVNFSLIDSNFGGRFNKDVSGSSNVTVTGAQAENVCHVLTGVLTGNIQYIFPATGAFYWVTNNTTGAFAITLAMAGGTTVRNVNQGETVGIFINPDGNFGVKFLTSSFTSRLGPLFLDGTAGTANAQTATISGPASELTTAALNHGTLYELIPSLTNTAANPTIAINGQAPLTVGGAAVPGALMANQLYLGQANGAGLLNLIASTIKYGGYVLRGLPQGFGANGTYNAAPGTRGVLVLLIGGGAGGSGAAATTSQQSNGGGGGGAGWSINLFTTAFTGGIAVTIGAGGAGGSGVAGVTGGTTSFGALLTATGGNPSGVANASPLTAVGVNSGSAGGSAGTGLFFGGTTRGGNGEFGLLGGGGGANMGGQGGDSLFGGGGFRTFGSTAGNAGSAFGAGGSGACNAGTQGVKLGGQGISGACYVFELA